MLESRNQSRTIRCAGLRFRTTLGALGLLCAIAPACLAQKAACRTDDQIARTLASGRKSGWSSVIITLDGRLTAEREAALRRVNVDIYRRLPLIDGVAARVPVRHLATLIRLPFVQHVSADLSVRKADEFTNSRSGATDVVHRLGLGGGGVTVAVLDSGIHMRHPDLIDTKSASGKSRVRKAISFLSNDPTTVDYCGHGTHVAGILAGNGAGSTGPQYIRTFVGVAPHANLISVKVLDYDGSSDVSTVIAGLQWIVANAAKYKIRVLNVSLGHPVGESYKTDPLCRAVEAAWKAGIVVVCAAGNCGRKEATQKPECDNDGYGAAYGSIQSPGNDPYVITVGATKAVDVRREHDLIASYSSRGPSRLDFILKPDIVAPGNRVVSLECPGSYLSDAYSSSNSVPMSSYVRNGSDAASLRYFCLSGTSMAAPVVSGAAALLLQKYPTLTPDTVKARLMISADKWGNPLIYGAGYLNIPAALNCTARAAQTFLSPPVVRDSEGDIYISSVLWGESVIWGEHTKDLQIIWGDSVRAVTGSLKPNQVIWGESFVPVCGKIQSPNQVIWGESVWSDSIICGDSSSAVDLTGTALDGEE